jgi:ketosteroid isomerase-like protein
MPERALAILERGYEAFNRDDPSAVIANATPDAEWGATGAFPSVATLYRGPQAIREWMKAIRSEWEEFEVGVDEVLHEEGGLIVVAERLRGRGRGSG